MLTQSGVSSLLLIDDDQSVRDSMATYLEDSGFVVHQASTGRQGIELFHSKHPDVVLTDLRMPDMDGLEVLRQLKEIDPQRSVIVVSGAGVMRDVVEALRLGASDFITKPVIDFAMLEHVVRRCISQQNLLAQNLRYREKLENANKSLSRQLALLRQDQRAGREAQLRLTPSTPVTYGDYTVGHKIIPSLYLSGDMVDHQLVAGRYLVASLLDVSGHGAAAAFITVLVRHWIRDYIDQTGVSDASRAPAEIMLWLHQHLEDLHLDHYATGFVAVVDTQTHEFWYSCAGHLPQPMNANRQRVVWLDNTGPPVGVFPGAQWQSKVVDMPERNRVLVFSDGLFEVLEGSVPEREQQLIDKIRKGGKHFRDWLGELERQGDLPDDIAVLDIYRGPDSE